LFHAQALQRTGDEQGSKAMLKQIINLQRIGGHLAKAMAARCLKQLKK